MTKVQNKTEKMISFQYPILGTIKWNHVEPNEIADVPEEHLWRALAHGLTEVKEPVKKKSKPK